MDEKFVVVFSFGLLLIFFVSFLCAAFEMRASVFKSLCACVLNMAFASLAVLLLFHKVGAFSIYFFLLFALFEALLSFEILWLAGGVEGLKKLLGRSIFCFVAGNIVFLSYWFFLFKNL